MRLIDERKKIVECFGLTMLLYVNIKDYKNIACTNFVNVSIAVNLHSDEENYSFILDFIKKIHLLFPFKS